MLYRNKRQIISRRFAGTTASYLAGGTAPVTAAPLTMAMWISPASWATSTQFLMSIGQVTGGAGPFTDYFSIQVSSSQLQVVIFENAAELPISTSFGITQTGNAVNNGWYFVCLVCRSNADRTLFLNNTTANNTTTVTPAAGAINGVTIGCNRIYDGTVTSPYQGQIATPAVWNIALSNDEVHQLRQGAYPTTVRRDNLVAFWDFRGHEREISHNGRHTLVNNATIPNTNGPAFLGEVFQSPHDLRAFPSASAPAAILKDPLGCGIIPWPR